MIFKAISTCFGEWDFNGLSHLHLLSAPALVLLGKRENLKCIWYAAVDPIVVVRPVNTMWMSPPNFHSGLLIKSWRTHFASLSLSLSRTKRKQNSFHELNISWTITTFHQFYAWHLDVGCARCRCRRRRHRPIIKSTIPEITSSKRKHNLFLFILGFFRKREGWTFASMTIATEC